MKQTFWNKKLQAAQCYVPGEQPQDRQYIKLNTNELPYPPSPKVAEALKNMDYERLRLYPDPTQKRLREALAEHFALEKEQVFVSNGSDEILAFCFQAFFEPQNSAAGSAGKPVLTAEQGYSFYPVYADFYGVPLKKLPLMPDMQIRVEDYGQASQAVIIANPNAPTGLFLDNEALRTLLEQDRQRLVIIDEAYVDFAPESAVSLLEDYNNLLVVRTYSKSRALAGIRLGFALAHPDLIRALEIVRDNFNSYTVDRVAETLGIAALEDGAYFAQSCANLIKTREQVKDRLMALGVELTDSQANFLWLKHPRLSGAAVYQGLKEQGVLVRYFRDPLYAGRVRVSIGTDEEMQVFLEAFSKL